MAVSFQSLEDELNPFKDLFAIFEATFQYPADTQLKSAKIAEDVKFICEAGNRAPGTHNYLADVWTVFIHMSCCIPPDHPWQACLVQATHTLRQEEGRVSGPHSPLWKELPNLAEEMREQWLEPGEEDNGDEPEEGAFAQWKNQMSFYARLSNPFFFRLWQPIWAIRVALEESPKGGAAEECRLWVATEWIIHCAELIYEKMDGEEVRELRVKTGPLCSDDIPDIGIKRWHFWKKRFTEIAVEAEHLRLGNDIVERISNAVKRMEAVEKQ